jgi:hypothetical protein
MALLDPGDNLGELSTKSKPQRPVGGIADLPPNACIVLLKHPTASLLANRHLLSITNPILHRLDKNAVPHRDFDLLGPVRAKEPVDAIAGSGVGQQRSLHFQDGLTQPLPIPIPVFGKAQEELPIMTPMSQVIEAARHDVTVGPGHSTGVQPAALSKK